MSVQQHQAELTNRSGEEPKSAYLRMSDLVLLSGAGRYDLGRKEEQTRSTQDLARFFFQAAKVAGGVDLFIEAGAKDGSSSRRARRLLDPKYIVAFEANPFTHARFEKVNADPKLRIDYLHRALSDRPGPVTFHVLRNEEGKPRADGQSSLLQRQSELDRGFIEVTVEATTLDEHFRNYDFERAALWMDVEGASQLVLTGGRAILEDGVALAIIEVEDRNYWGEGQWLGKDVVSYMYDRGLVPVARDFQSRYQYNIVFLRRDLLDVDQIRWALAVFNSANYSQPAPHKAVSAKAQARRILGGVRRRYLHRST